jgi:hypothetical protein
LDKTIIGLVSAASALALGAPPSSSAGPAPLPAAQTYAELLDPIPDAVSRLSTQWGDGKLNVTADDSPAVELAQYYHHHHHHHHHWWRHYHHHHHWHWRHHHHHHHYY